jgi:hypothetical protein
MENHPLSGVPFQKRGVPDIMKAITSKTITNKNKATKFGLTILGALTLLMGTSQNSMAQQGMNPTVAAILQTVVASGIGAGTGALMQKSPGWANGAVSATAGSVGSQVVNALVNPQRNNNQSYNNNGYNGGYNNGYNNNSRQQYYQNNYQPQSQSQQSYGSSYVSSQDAYNIGYKTAMMHSPPMNNFPSDRVQNAYMAGYQDGTSRIRQQAANATYAPNFN